LDRTASPQLWCILDEGVLHRAIGGSKVMRSQLFRLAEVAEHPKTTIQVIRSGGTHAVAIRDSNHPDGPQLAFPPATWKTFTERLKAASPA
jgi:Domain of unknown function (DUF5753)/Domain of unknown function (DUF397)